MISNIPSNNNSLFLQNQHCHKKSLLPESDFSKIPERVLTTIYNNAPKTFSVLAYLAQHNNCHKKIFVSQETISSRLGISRKQVSRAIKLFGELGIITKTNRGYKKSCVYELHPFFYDPRFRERMWHLFKAFRWTPKNPDVLLKFQLINKRNTNNRYKFSIRNVPLSLTRREKDITIYPDYLVGMRARGDLIQEKKHKNRENILFVKNPWLKRSYGPMKQFTQREYEGTPVPPYIKAITEIPLSKWGQIKLTCFPEEAIADARRKITLFPNTRNPYSFFWFAAKDYCKANNIVPDMRWLDKLCESHHVPADAKMVLSGPTGELDTFIVREEMHPAYGRRWGYKNNQEGNPTERARIQHRAFKKVEDTRRENERMEAERIRVENDWADKTPESLLAQWEAYMGTPKGQFIISMQHTIPLWNSLFPQVQEALAKNEFPPETYQRLYAQYPALQASVAFERERLKRDEGKGNTTSNTTAGTFGSLSRQSTDTGAPVGLSSQIYGIMHNKVNE